MSTQKTSHSKATKVHPPMHVANTTDATRGMPLAVRAKQRREELAGALEKLPANEMRSRIDIEMALASFDELLTGDLDRLSDATGFELSRLIERTKHLAEIVPRSRHH